MVRLMANAAVHGLAGTVLGVTTVLAACTVARSVRQTLKRSVRETATEDGISANR
jgi:hypothetical protein